MGTLAMMLALMVGPSAIARLVSGARGRRWDVLGAAAVGLTLLFLLTGLGHFVQTEAMALMVPAWVPGRVPLVYLTGILELALAAGFLLPAPRRVTGWVAAIMLVLFFPANVYAAVNHVPVRSRFWRAGISRSGDA